ncbi:hypothetical protein MMALV_13030 [Candidatus Methanomethylophilus alvi Mx1201]|uniref:NurA domain-containing protein n=2 Tax=Methanomethylophilus alvi TaxID=1291540 RepID=M9SIU9_METAX|nr:DNA double-strand break repair nuclease NurA [Methanomethylophilus alvi]AGI86033.1 hypothetical protein MMALV_13030 [Candidatus Methanomethylophilus alvi Mx1201]AYQ55414.1 hypothetical protein BKD89_06335 [Methanomethylophilus alvi]
MDATSSIKSKLVMDKSFKGVLEKLSNSNISLPTSSTLVEGNIDLDSTEYLIKCIEPSEKYPLNVRNGYSVAIREGTVIAAYDESFKTYAALEGKAVCASHSLVIVRDSDYVPISFLTLKFYTRSDGVKDKLGDAAIVADNVDHRINVDMALDKMQLLDEYCGDNWILFIDGPLVGGDSYTTFMPQIQKFLEKGIMPIFCVKNSSSNLVTQYLPEYKGVYNSDMHWANNLLKQGERTAFFEYIDSHNSSNSKVFCYIKFLDKCSPVRVEIPTCIYRKYWSSIADCMDLTLYLILAQGNEKNAQVRPIAIAEMFARETLHLIDLNQEIRRSKLTETMNQARWGDDDLDSTQ